MIWKLYQTYPWGLKLFDDFLSCGNELPLPVRRKIWWTLLKNDPLGKACITSNVDWHLGLARKWRLKVRLWIRKVELNDRRSSLKTTPSSSLPNPSLVLSFVLEFYLDLNLPIEVPVSDKKIFDFPMAKLKCFQCRIVHKNCQEVRKLVSKVENLFHPK